MNLKKSNAFLLLQTLVFVVFTQSFSSCNTNEPKEEKMTNVDEIISKMTLEQKAQLLIGTGMDFQLPDSIAEQYGIKPEIYKDSSYHIMVDKVRAILPGAAGFTAEFPDLGITTQALADGPAGLRIKPQREGIDKTYFCTAFPIATVLASSWDVELVENVGKAMGNEVLEYGADVLLAPGMNLQRDPLCGRNFEYYSEDPLVTGKMAAAMVKGVQSNGVGTSIKHFAANNQETNRLSVNTIVSERALRELYLKGFEIAVTEAKPWTVMSSYNKINGQYTSESHDLLTKILRDDWGFDGYVMTDWGGGSDVIAQMEAGNDLIMPGRPKTIEALIKAVEEGKIKEEILDRNISRIFNIMLKTPKYKKTAYSSNPDLKAHAEVTRQAATDGMVLLENKEKALPIPSEIKNIAVFGTTSYEFISGGTGSGDVNEAYTVSLIEGIKNGGLVINEELAKIYNDYITVEKAKERVSENWLAAAMGVEPPVEEMNIDKKTCQQMAENSEIALITIGRNSGEGGDRKAEPGDFYLTDVEKSLIKNVTEAFHAKGKKAIVILNIGAVIETASWKEIPDAVLCAWQPGQEAGNSVVDVLTGKVNPSGKLAVTFPVDYKDCSSAKNFPGIAIEGEEDDKPDESGFSFLERVPWEVVYEEDIYVGYRYFNTFNIPVSYEFGYGKSYTEFEYSNLKLNASEFTGSMVVTIDIKNTGSVAGREVVQIYVTAPEGNLENPQEELVAFGKTKLLQPGNSETLSFTVTTKELASFDESSSSWIVEAGSYNLKAGASSTEIKQETKFDIKEDLGGGKVTKALAPNREIKKLTRK